MFSINQVILFMGAGVVLVLLVVGFFYAKQANAQQAKYERDNVAAGYPARGEDEGWIKYHERIDAIKAEEAATAAEDRDPADTILYLRQHTVDEMAKFDDLSDEGLTRELATFSARDIEVMQEHGMLVDSGNGKLVATEYAAEVVTAARERAERYGSTS